MKYPFRLVLIVVSWMVLAGTSPGEISSGFHKISWAPQKIMTGSPCIFRVEMTVPATSVNGRWQKRELAFVASPDGHIWYALAGVDVETKPAYYPLEVQATLANGSQIREQRSVLVTRAKFATEQLKVPHRFVEPDRETLVRIEADEQLKHAAFSEQNSAEWSGAFRPPIDSAISEAFGTRRTFNGKLASIHRGVDYHAAPGSPISAANGGAVVLARELFYEGNCVIIDHGHQFTTIYMHLSQIEVSEGQKVQTGQEIGLSGATGRVTGPHLHLAARWQGAFIDPEQLWTLPLPKLQAASVPRVTTR